MAINDLALHPSLNKSIATIGWKKVERKGKCVGNFNSMLLLQKNFHSSIFFLSIFVLI